MQEQITDTAPVKGSKKVFRYIKRFIIVVLLLFVLIIVIAIIDGSNDKKSPADIPANITTVKETPVKETKQNEVKSFQIDVASQIVKKVDSKYRYFFDIRNNDTKDFSGTVKISIVNKLGKEVFYDIFDTSFAVISPKVGKSVYFDASTGPESVHGDYGITKFIYEAKLNNSVVKTGEGVISNAFEDLSS